MTEMVQLSKSSSPTESQLCLAFPASHVMWRLQDLGKITAAVLMGKIEAVLSAFESKCGHIARLLGLCVTEPLGRYEHNHSVAELLLDLQNKTKHGHSLNVPPCPSCTCMISPKNLIRMARKWQKVAALDSCSTSSVADKGHFVVYSSDRRRFVIPLAYLNSEIFRELFQMSEEEFGIQSAGPIILPCDSVFMDYVISFIQRGIAKDLGRALIMSIASSNCSSSSYFPQEQNNDQLLLCAF
ncbi:hypothetical protein AAG906_003044 [Vitis piasezkii]